ncbi:SDR family NAD(P)-dependent oxidoreductase [Mycolicibacterium sp. 120270]|uniref:SDR family NAD(P)-dependent oxidoreductase n=1 Tax=Mycolicibacterium sp. 120270 TaxID=3090600 RepID=UPI00299E4215|nr:SDR family oxidoreductase [Mycolicibacterium sp. 120270]MDX1886606.1 SDR family oxidoreductase [Mycolicibacterium sp. 120270]
MALEQFQLDGQVAIVTGAGRGVGEGIAKVLAEAGATVVGTARTTSEIEATISDIKAAGGNGLALTADALQREDSERVVKTAVEEFGRIDILVNNVGFHVAYAPFLDQTDENLRSAFEYCVTSAFIMSQLVVPHMLRVGAGSIVNISSGASRFGIRGLLPYSVAKGGLEALTRAMAQELAPKIRVNAISLGSFMTGGLQYSFDLIPGSEEKLKELTPLHRVGDVADLGRLTLYLSTRDCYATSSVFIVDGGLQGPNSTLPMPDL